MPEIRECLIHYKHAHYVLVEELGLGQTPADHWALQALLADATNAEAGISKDTTLRPGLTDKHANGYIDRLDSSCTLMRGQTANQTRIWPGTMDSPETIDGLILSGLSYTPRALILQFGRLDPEKQNLLRTLDLQVWFYLYGI